MEGMRCAVFRVIEEWGHDFCIGHGKFLWVFGGRLAEESSVLIACVDDRCVEAPLVVAFS